jgi:hypothetical protein
VSPGMDLLRLGVPLHRADIWHGLNRCAETKCPPAAGRWSWDRSGFLTRKALSLLQPARSLLNTGVAGISLIHSVGTKICFKWPETLLLSFARSKASEHRRRPFRDVGNHPFRQVSRNIP